MHFYSPRFAGGQRRGGVVANNEIINSGTAPQADNFRVFFPSEAGFKILFNEYQVAPYVAGPQEIVIPYSALKGVINSSGPLRSI